MILANYQSAYCKGDRGKKEGHPIFVCFFVPFVVLGPTEEPDRC